MSVAEEINGVFNTLSIEDQTRTLDVSDELLTHVHRKFPASPVLQFVSLLLAYTVLSTHLQSLVAPQTAPGVKH